MKICPRCGVSQKDDRQTCIDCGAVLGSPVDEETAYQTEKSRRESISDLEERTDIFSLGRARIPLLIIDAAGLLTVVLLLIFRQPFEQHFHRILDPAAPFCALIFFLLALINTLCPKLTWEMEQVRLKMRYSNADNLMPGGLWLFGKILICYIFPFFGAAVLAYGLLFY